MIHSPNDHFFYGQQANQFSFYRIPKIFFSDGRYTSLSIEAKILYGILLDRMELSARNHWLDEKGRVYIIFTIEEVMDCLGCANKKAGALLSELEKKAGLIERKRQGLGKPNLIYVKNFVSPSEHIQNCQKDISKDVIPTVPEMSESHGNHTDIILVVGLGEEYFTSLPPKMMSKYKEMFHQPEAFFHMGRSIIALPIPDHQIKGEERPKKPKIKNHNAEL